MIDVNKIRADFPILSRKVNGQDLVYFDNAATTPIEKKVLDKMLPFMEDGFGNPSSIVFSS